MKKMKRKIMLLLLFTFLFSLDNTNAIELSNDNDNIISEIRIQNINNKEKKKESNVTIIDDKYQLKKEIRKRRVYHRNLLYMYNKDFDNKNLELITNNWLLISNLENHYKLTFL